MKKHISLIIVGFLFMTGCLLAEDQGTQTVGNVPDAPPDFTAVPDETQPDEDDNLPEPPTDKQNPSPVPGFNEIPSEEVDFVLNQGAQYIGGEDLELSMVAPPLTYTRMMLSMDGSCSNLELEPFTESLTIPVHKRNGVNQVSVRYVDDDFVVTQCMSRQVIHDDLPPEIVVTKYPVTSIEQGSPASIAYTITDASPIADVVCRLNDLQRPCGAGSVNVDITALPEGHYTFSIDAVDIVGNASHTEVSWDVVSTTKHLEQTFLVNNYNKVDILVVIDNSGSMEYEQRNMAQRVSNFLAILKGLDWRIAVTTTDPSSTSATNSDKKQPSKVSDGLFLPIAGLNNQFYIDSTMDPVEAQTRLGNTLQRPERGSGSEQAINATYRAIERGYGPDANKNPIQRNFFRPGAHFAVVVISDEDESANKMRNDPQNLLNLVNTTFNGQKAFSWHSIITRPGDTACRNTHGYSYGHRYYDFSILTGGLIGSVCEQDYAAQLMGVASKIRNLVKTLTLTCQPLPQFPITVKKDGANYAGGYAIEGVNLNFDSELSPGLYTVNYHCLK